MNNNIIIFAAALLLLSAAHGCVKAPDYPDEPVITYLNVSKTSVVQGNPTARFDTLILFIGFTDGDGDLSFSDEVRDSVDLILTDSRDGTAIPYRIPFITPLGTGNGISGEITVTLQNRTQQGVFNICCIYGAGTIPCSVFPGIPTNSFRYSVQLKDRAGNLSNVMETGDITILCQ